MCCCRPAPDLSLRGGGVARYTGLNGVPAGYRVLDGAYQSDGKLLALLADFSDVTPAIIRINPDGNLDPTFGSNGIVTEGFNSSERALAIAVQSDGGILVAGVDQGTADVSRFLPDGTLDTGFGTGGLAKFSSPVTSYSANSIAVRPDDSIVLGGNATSGDPSGGNDFALFATDRNGVADLSFGSGGVATVDFSRGDDNVAAIGQLSDGRIVESGTTQPIDRLSAPVLALAQFDSSGHPDATFNGTGQLEPAQLTAGAASHLAVNGTTTELFDTTGGANQFTVAHFNADGTPDANFGTNGVQLISAQTSAAAVGARLRSTAPAATSSASPTSAAAARSAWPCRGSTSAGTPTPPLTGPAPPPSPRRT